MIERLRREGLIVPARPLLVMLSGGRDSTCLLHAAVTIAGAEAVEALHVNYSLRTEADGDEAFCRELCAGLGVALHVHRAGEPTGNLQAWARAERYRAAARLGDTVAAGHTADDQLETIVYRLISSPSRRAVLGMRAREGIVVRPLLGVTRAETTAYCERHGLRWREDASNESGAYVRNRIRHELLPLLRELHPGAGANLLALAGRLRAEGEVLDAIVDETLAGAASIELARLRALPPALARLVVQRLADEALDAPAAGVGARADVMLQRLRERGTSMLDVGSGLRAVSEYGVVRIEPIAPPAPVPEPVSLPIPGEAMLGVRLVRCELTAPERRDGVLDREALGAELTVRTWRPGDRVRPLGLDGTKSLQDLFTDRRVPRAQRATVPVVAAGEEIVWVAGVATAERFKVTDATRTAVRLSTAP